MIKTTLVFACLPGERPLSTSERDTLSFRRAITNAIRMVRGGKVTLACVRGEGRTFYIQRRTDGSYRKWIDREE